jgi:carbamoyltransferase
MKNLCLAGGVALNCVGNGKFLQEKIFDEIWIQPAAGDAGGALGAALYNWHQVMDQPRRVKPGRDSQRGSLLGPAFSNDDIDQFLQSVQAPATLYDDEALFDEIARRITEGQVVGFFQGPMEFGPRALGSRSILGDPRSPTLQKQMNLKIKFRESFRPFAPSCLQEDVPQIFDLQHPSPYMLLVAPVRSERRREPRSHDQASGASTTNTANASTEKLSSLDRVNEVRSDFPAITHVDHSARVQSVSEDVHPRYYKLLKSIKKMTGEGIVINTSFNIRGEPIVCSPADAYRCFMATDIDVLVLENYICLKDTQPKGPDTEQYKQQFVLD